MLYKIFHRLGMLTAIIDSRTVGMRPKHSNRNYFLARLCYSNSKVAILIFATYNKSLLV
jgi:hypothetical protein